MHPHLNQEIARQRYAELLREGAADRRVHQVSEVEPPTRARRAWKRLSVLRPALRLS